jgi:hypothetical protein
MLLAGFFKYRFVLQQLLDLGEQGSLLVVMVRLNELEPGEAVADEVSLVLIENNRRLVVNGVVTTENRVI